MIEQLANLILVIIWIVFPFIVIALLIYPLSLICCPTDCHVIFLFWKEHPQIDCLWFIAFRTMVDCCMSSYIRSSAKHVVVFEIMHQQLLFCCCFGLWCSDKYVEKTLHTWWLKIPPLAPYLLCLAIIVVLIHCHHLLSLPFIVLLLLFRSAPADIIKLKIHAVNNCVCNTMKRRRREDLRILLVEGEWCGDGWAAQTWTLGEQHSRSCFIRVGIDESRGRIYFMGSWYGQRVVVAAIHSIVGDNWGVGKRSPWCCRCLIWHWGCGCGCVLWKMNEEAGRRQRRRRQWDLLQIFCCQFSNAIFIRPYPFILWVIGEPT